MNHLQQTPQGSYIGELVIFGFRLQQKSMENSRYMVEKQYCIWLIEKIGKTAITFYSLNKTAKSIIAASGRETFIYSI